MCKDVPTTVFYPGRGEGQAAAAEYARRWCRVCPVIDACREWALEGDEEGVWGGLTRNQRRRIQHANKE